VYLGPGLLGHLDTIAARHVPKRALFTVTDDVVAELLNDWRLDPRHAWREPHSDPQSEWLTTPIAVPPGESTKSRDEWSRVTDILMERSAGRDSAIVAIGGGVVGDLAGFVAATYMRGIPFITVPTTLLAMVDASIGGKTAVDTTFGKNLVGAFHQPAAVVADLRCLDTLSDAEFRVGLSEAIKQAVMADHVLFDWMAQRHTDILARDLGVLEELVAASVRLKAAVVEADEREEGRRAHLNLGHTVAHALERSTDYQLSHGEAVSLGLVVEAALAADLGLAPVDIVDRILDVLKLFSLPTQIGGGPSRAEVIAAMRYDKKGTNSQIRFALPAGIGAMAAATAPWTVALDDSDRISRALGRIGLA
jgi:3-dehydroquinate synthase